MLYRGVQYCIGVYSAEKGCTVLYRGVQCCIGCTVLYMGVQCCIGVYSAV